MNAPRNCMSCIHYREVSDQAQKQSVGQCWANPPTAQAIPIQTPPSPSAPNGGFGLQIICIRPQVGPTDVCGWHDDGTDDAEPFDTTAGPDVPEAGQFRPGRAPLNLDDLDGQ